MLMLAIVVVGEIQSVPFLPGNPWDSCINGAHHKSSSFSSQMKGVFPLAMVYSLMARSNPKDSSFY